MQNMNGTNFSKYLLIKLWKKHFFFVLLLFFSTFLNAQEKKQSISFNGILSHYMKAEDSYLGLEHGYYFYPITPGIELLYKLKLNNKLVLGLGINYQFGRNASNVSGPRRFKFQELSIPVILQKEFTLNGKNWHLTTGIYGGKLIKLIAEHPNKYWEWREWSDYSTLELYSEDEIFIDIYLDIQKQIYSWKKSRLLVAPYTSFRINTTWLTNYQKKLHYGLKISYELKV